MPYDFTPMWNLMSKLNQQAKRQTQRERADWQLRVRVRWQGPSEKERICGYGNSVVIVGGEGYKGAK